MLTIFKNYASSMSILDDFDFYENRQKIMQEKRIRQCVPNHDLQVFYFLSFLFFLVLIFVSFVNFGCKLIINTVLLSFHSF